MPSIILETEATSGLTVASWNDSVLTKIMTDSYTLGVEEEYQLVNPQTRELCGRAGKVFQAARDEENRVHRELHRCQIEIATDVCQSLDELFQELQRSRRIVVKAAQEQGVAVVAAGTHPFSAWEDQKLTEKQRYLKLAQDLKQVIRELIIFGCHIHVGLNGTYFHDHPEIAIEVVNRCRLWLSPLLALTANSPFWEGSDTGYDSFRSELWCRLPTAGPPPHLSNHSEYQSFVQTLIRSAVIRDTTTLYWDIRLSDAFPTLEFRIADVCMTIEEAVMLAGLVKALVKTCYEAAIAQKPYPLVKSELLKAAHWTAARYGLSANLIDLENGKAIPAKDSIHQFMAYLQPALVAEGDWDKVNATVQKVLADGNGAYRQRCWYKESNSMQSVVDRLIDQTGMHIADI